MIVRRKKSNRVAQAIAKLYAKMAQAAAEKAVLKVAVDQAGCADTWAGHATRWLELAGADAVRDYFNPKI